VTKVAQLGEREITRIGLGTNRLSNSPENQAFVREALDAGVNFIDTAYLYAGGESERTLGEALSKVVDGCIVATKGGFSDGRPEVIRAELEESLRRLAVETIDLYYLHRVDAAVPVETSLAAVKEYVDRGSVRYVGVSEVGVEQIERARQVVPIAAVQNRYNLSERRHEDVVDYCAEQQILFVPFYPLRGDAPALDEVARAHGATESQIALAWLLKRSSTMVPIPGTLSVEHVRENLGALEIELSDEEFEALR
jgi:pyridoxine 4-dehydrogenase